MNAAFFVFACTSFIFHMLLWKNWQTLPLDPLSSPILSFLVLVLLGFLLSPAEKTRWQQVRRLILFFSTTGILWLQFLYTSHYQPTTLSLAMVVLIGLCAGGECRVLRDTHQAPKPAPTDLIGEIEGQPTYRGPFHFSFFFMAVLGTGFVTIWYPYFGVVVSGFFHTLQVALWLMASLEKQPHENLTKNLELQLLLLILLTGLLFYYTPGKHLSQPEFTPVDTRHSGKRTFYLERHLHKGIWYAHSRNPKERPFFSTEAHRWGESLVHPAMIALPPRAQVLLLGGEQGMVLRELLRYTKLEKIDLFTSQPQRLQFFSQQPLLRRLHQSSFQHPKVHTHPFSDTASLLKALKRTKKRYHRIFHALEPPYQSDFPYSTAFFRVLHRKLHKQGKLAVFWGNTQPFMAYVCMLHRLRQAKWNALPYRGFGIDVMWGFALASPVVHSEATPNPTSKQMTFPRTLDTSGLRYLSRETLPRLFTFSAEQQRLLRQSSRCDE